MASKAFYGAVSLDQINTFTNFYLKYLTWVLQSPVSCTQASPEGEASNRPKQAQHFFTHRKVQNGNQEIQDLPNSGGMGIVNISIG